MFINKINAVSSNMGFKGYQHVKNDVGETILRFNYPFNPKEETCEIHFFRVVRTDKYNYKVIEKPIKIETLEEGGKDINLQELTNLDRDESFAYKIVRKDKQGKIIWEGPDTGVKLRQLKNGEFGFNNDQRNRWVKTEYDPLNSDGTYKKDATPNEKELWYESTVLFNDDIEKNYKYTLVKRNGTTPMVQGPGYLAMPDTNMPGMKYKGFDEKNTGEVYYDEDYQKKMEGMVKTFSNMYGGSLAGLEALIPYLKKNGFKMLFTTPIANGDDRTSHGYWNKNNMQIAPNMGNIENYDSLMQNEFKNGIAHVFDATLTSEGLEGIHLRYALRWGEQAQTSKWFRLNGLKDSGLGFGVIPNNAKNLRHRVINPPYLYKLKNDGTYEKITNNEYNANKETLLQIYDASQVTDDQLSKLDEPIKMYNNLKSGKILAINTYDDTLVNYVFEINPNEYQKRIDVINDLNKNEGKNIKLDTPDGTILATNLSNFHITRTSDGYVAWDDNPDMVKMNYGISAYDEKELQSIVDKAQRQFERDLIVRGSKEVQDMAIQVGIYWAERTKNAHTIYTAQTIGNAKSAATINKLIEEGKLPKECKVSQTVIDNILNGEYNLAPKGILDKDDITIKALMKVPLDTLEFGDNVTGVLSTSYFSNRATTDETLGLSRFELYKQNNPHLVDTYANVYKKTNDMFTNELNEFAQSVIKKVNETSNEPLIDSDGNYTEYGEYVIDFVGQNIARYALLKSISGDSFKYKMLQNGTLTYDYNNIRKATTLKSLGINASNPTEEAEILQNKIHQGLKKLSDTDIKEVAKSISTMIKGTDKDSFRIAEALVDISGLGLNYRLDAAKDVMDIDSIWNRDADMDDTWTNLINFWGKYVQGVKSINPHSYIVAEMTDVDQVMRIPNGGPESCPYNGWTDVNGVKYNTEPDAMTKFFNETGITSEAAYAYFFTELLKNFSKEFEKGEGYCSTHDDFKHRYDLLINTRSADYLRNLYTFMGNHDKTRTLHGLALDMGLFHSSLIYRGADFGKNHSQRLDVIRVMSGAKNDKDIPLELRLNVDNLNYFRTISTRAVAQTKLLSSSVEEDLKGLTTEEDINLIKEALIDLANGNYMTDKNTEKMTRINIKEISSVENAVKEVANLAKKYGANLSENEIKTIISKVNNLDFENYIIRGDFDWTEPQYVGENNKQYLSEILGNYASAMEYSLYTVQIARMIKKGAEGTKNANIVNEALKDFVKKYNRATITQNSDDYKLYEDPIISRKKNGYAARDFRIAMEEAINQAEYKSGRKIKNSEDIINTVYKSVTEPAVQKHAMILSYLGALCGISTMYGADEDGATGYEDKAKNIWLQNRMPTLLSAIKDPNSDIGAIKRAYREKTLATMSNKAKVKALQNGTPYNMDVMTSGKTRDEIKARIAAINKYCEVLSDTSSLKKHFEKEREFLTQELGKVAFMLQGADGEIAVSVFNGGNIEHDNRVNYFDKLSKETGKNLNNRAERIKFFKENNIDTLNIDNPYIPIQQETKMNAILLGAGVTIPIGTIFFNADMRDKAKYVVEKVNGKIGIVKKEGNKICDIVLNGLTAKNGVMVLRKIPFKGKHSSNSKIYNEQYNIVSSPYKKEAISKKGENLSVISR